MPAVGHPIIASSSETLPTLLLPLAEAIVRGYKLGLLRHADYNNLCQCESLDDIKLYLVRSLGGGGRARAGGGVAVGAGVGSLAGQEGGSWREQLREGWSRDSVGS